MKTENDKSTQEASSAALASYVVAGGGGLVVGGEYEVRHSRKGTFRMKITALREEWIDGIISDGTAGAMMSYNVRGEGEEITIRDCHSYFIPVGGRQQPNGALQRSSEGSSNE